jgi:hypothetical protein
MRCRKSTRIHLIRLFGSSRTLKSTFPSRGRLFSTARVLFHTLSDNIIAMMVEADVYN